MPAEKRAIGLTILAILIITIFAESRGAEMRTRFQSGRLAAGISPGGCRAGFTLVELVIGMSLLAFGLLGIATMFSTGYTDIAAGGKNTMSVAAARQAIEDMRLIPFQNLSALIGLNISTNSSASQPANNPERAIVRKFRYAVAGPGRPADNWNFTTAEINQWSMLSVMSGASFGGSGQIAVAQAGGSSTLLQVTVTVTGPGRPKPVQLVTLISRL
jgi:prepilin-type N-terminal cleavage/methylation domain-containing protein